MNILIEMEERLNAEDKNCKKIDKLKEKTI